MKRSEMIETIAHKLERCHDRYGNLHNFEMVANELLEDIEEAGMLPPLTSNAKELYYTSDHDSRDIGKAYDYFKWDKE